MFGDFGSSDSLGTHNSQIVPLSVHRCKEHGTYVAFLVDGGRYTGCSLCAQASVLKATSRAIHSLEVTLRTAGVPESLLHASFSTFAATNDEQVSLINYVQDIAQRWSNGDLSEGGSLVLLGGAETGKTHVALAILRHIALTHTVAYVDASLDRRVVHDEHYLLVIDNAFYSGDKPPEKMRKRLNEVMYERSLARLPTIIVSDQSKVHFRNLFSERTLYGLRSVGTKIVHFF